MRRVFASAMLCLLLLLPLGAARCEAQCAGATMPMQPSSATQTDVSMDDGMEHCGGAQHAQDGVPLAGASCDTPLCHHQAVPATTESRFELDTQWMPSTIALTVALPTRAARRDATRSPRLHRTPLDRSSSLRV